MKPVAAWVTKGVSVIRHSTLEKYGAEELNRIQGNVGHYLVSVPDEILNRLPPHVKVDLCMELGRILEACEAYGPARSVKGKGEMEL